MSVSGRELTLYELSTKLRYPAARVSLGAIFFIMGLTKIFSFAGVAGWMASSGLPFAKALLVLTIALEVAGRLLLILGRQTRWAALALALFTIPVTLVFHAFWSADAAQFQDQLTHFLKNLAIFGGLLLLIDRPRNTELSSHPGSRSDTFHSAGYRNGFATPGLLRHLYHTNLSSTPT